MYGDGPRGDCHRQLTPRQTQILQLAAEGHGNKQIGKELGIKRDTVRNTLRAAAQKLHANNRTTAVVAAWRRGWIT